MTPESTFNPQGQQGPPSADPRMLLAMGLAGQQGPSAEDTSAGLVEQLKGIMAAAVEVASAAPSTSQVMDEIRRLALQAVIQIGQSAPQQGGVSPMPGIGY